MQLCMDVQIPAAFNGVGGQAVYIGMETERERVRGENERNERLEKGSERFRVSHHLFFPLFPDTEGSLVPERAADLAEALSRHLGRLAARADAGTPAGAAKRAAAAATTPASLLAGVTVLRARDAAEQVAACSGLAALVEANPAIRLVVLDSVAFHVRAGVGGGGGGGGGGDGASARRTAALSATAAALTSLARSRGIAVVLTNQVTTRIGGAAGGGENEGGPSSTSRLVPALGAAWAHVPATRLLLHFGKGGKRLATLVKSPSLPGGSAEYAVLAEGVRGVVAAGAGGGGPGKRGRE